MEGDPALRLAQAAIARLCHDLGGAVGTIFNGIELATTQDSMTSEALQLASDAAQEVAARLRLARALWDDQNPLDLAGLPSLAQGLPNRARLHLDLDGLAPATLPPHPARLLLAALITAAESLHGPGQITLAGPADSEIVIMIDGPRAAWPPDLLGPEPATPTPRALAPFLLALLVRPPLRASLLLSSGPAAGPPPLLLRWK